MHALRRLAMMSLGCLIVSIAGCSGFVTTPEVAPAPEPPSPATTVLDPSPPDPQGLTPEETVLAFYTWYIDYSPGSALRDGSLASTGYLTDDHLARLRETAAAFVGGGADLLLCAQDVPTSVAVEAAQVEGDRATVLISTSFAGHTLEIDLQRRDGRWLIDRVHCGARTLTLPPTPTPPPLAAPPEVTALDWAVYMESAQGWPTYRDEEFGFALRYPEGWTCREFRAGLHQPLIGPPNVRLVVHFLPQEWAARTPSPLGPDITPFVLEVSEGSLEEFRTANPEPAQSAVLEALGPGATWEEEAVTESLSLQRYVFEHPDNPRLRITLLDPISGFPDRCASGASAVELFRGMVATFAYAK